MTENIRLSIEVFNPNGSRLCLPCTLYAAKGRLKRNVDP